MHGLTVMKYLLSSVINKKKKKKKYYNFNNNCLSQNPFFSVSTKVSTRFRLSPVSSNWATKRPFKSSLLLYNLITIHILASLPTLCNFLKLEKTEFKGNNRVETFFLARRRGFLAFCCHTLTNLFRLTNHCKKF